MSAFHKDPLFRKGLEVGLACGIVEGVKTEEGGIPIAPFGFIPLEIDVQIVKMEAITIEKRD